MSSMGYRTLGRTGLLVSELCLGTMTFGGTGRWKAAGEQTQNDANDIVARSIDDVHADGWDAQLNHSAGLLKILS